jgi:BASS family bile acid:Na+ symporter
MNNILKLFNNRNFILLLALFIGFILGNHSAYLVAPSSWFLALVMVFTTTGFSFYDWKPITKTIRIIGISFLLNFVVFGLILIGLGILLFDDELMILGILLLVISPPGPSVVPFTAALNGNVPFAVTGVFGLHLVAIIITPALLVLFLGNSAISTESVVLLITKVIIAPLILSRIIRRTPLKPYVEKYRGHVVNWGFFLIIIPIVGMSKSIIVAQPDMVLKNSLLFFIAMFAGGFLFNIISNKLKVERSTTIAANLLFTTKSSAFAAVASFSLVPPEAGLPLAIHAVFITLYFIIYDFMLNKFQKKSFLSTDNVV